MINPKPAETDYKYSPHIINVKKSPCMVKLSAPSSPARPRVVEEAPKITCQRLGKKLRDLEGIIHNSYEKVKQTQLEVALPALDLP
jgi:hypothetical protein